MKIKTVALKLLLEVVALVFSYIIAVMISVAIGVDLSSVTTVPTKLLIVLMAAAQYPIWVSDTTMLRRLSVFALASVAGVVIYFLTQYLALLLFRSGSAWAIQTSLYIGNFSGLVGFIGAFLISAKLLRKIKHQNIVESASHNS